MDRRRATLRHAQCGSGGVLFTPFACIQEYQVLVLVIAWIGCAGGVSSRRIFIHEDRVGVVFCLAPLGRPRADLCGPDRKRETSQGIEQESTSIAACMCCCEYREACG